MILGGAAHLNYLEFRPEVVFITDPTFVYSSTYGFINHTDHRGSGYASLSFECFAFGHLTS
jgi:hypothetical protein